MTGQQLEKSITAFDEIGNNSEAKKMHALEFFYVVRGMIERQELVVVAPLTSNDESLRTLIEDERTVTIPNRYAHKVCASCGELIGLRNDIVWLPDCVRAALNFHLHCYNRLMKKR